MDSDGNWTFARSGSGNRIFRGVKSPKDRFKELDKFESYRIRLLGFDLDWNPSGNSPSPVVSGTCP